MSTSVKSSLLGLFSLTLVSCQPVEDLESKKPSLQKKVTQEYYHKAMVVGETSQEPTFDKINLKALDDGSVQLEVTPYKDGLQRVQKFTIDKKNITNSIVVPASSERRMVIENLKNAFNTCKDSSCVAIPKLTLQKKEGAIWSEISTDWLAFKADDEQKLGDVQNIICRKLLELDKSSPLHIENGIDKLFSNVAGNHKLHIPSQQENSSDNPKGELLRAALKELMAGQLGVKLKTEILERIATEKGKDIFPQTQAMLSGYMLKKLLSNQFLIDLNYLFGEKEYFGLKFFNDLDERTDLDENQLHSLVPLKSDGEGEDQSKELEVNINKELVVDIFNGKSTENYNESFSTTFKLLYPEGVLNTELTGNSRFIPACEAKIKKLFDVTAFYANLPESPENTPIRFSSLMFFPFGNILSIHLEGETSENQLLDPFIKNKRHPSFYSQNFPKSSFNLLTISNEHTSFAEQIKNFLESSVFADYAVRIFSRTKRLSLKNLSISGDRVLKQGNLSYPTTREEQVAFKDERPVLKYEVPNQGLKEVAGPIFSEWEFPSLEELILDSIYSIHSDTKAVRKDFSQVKPLISQYSIEKGFSKLNKIIVKDMLPWGIIWDEQKEGEVKDGTVIKAMSAIGKNSDMIFPDGNEILDTKRLKVACFSYEQRLNVPAEDSFPVTPNYPCLSNTGNEYCSEELRKRLSIQKTLYLNSTKKLNTDNFNCSAAFL